MTLGYGSNALAVAEPGKAPKDFGTDERRCRLCRIKVNRYRAETRVGARNVLLCCNCSADDWRDARRPKPAPKAPHGNAGVELVGLRRAMRRKGWTQPMLADALGCSVQHVSGLCRGTNRCSPHRARAVAAVLGVPAPALVVGDS